MDNLELAKDKNLNYWWLIISFYGFIHFSVHRITYPIIPIGFIVFSLGILTFYAKENINKISYGFSICLILICSMHYGFNNTTSPYFAFLMSCSIVLIYCLKNLSIKEVYFSLLAVPSICDIFAGLNKLVPKNNFLYSELLKNILKNNIFNEPQFIIENINIVKLTIPYLEIFAGLLILINPKKALPLIIILHIPISLLTGRYVGHNIQLLTYSLFLIFPTWAAITIKNKYMRQETYKSIFISFLSNTKLFLFKPTNYIQKKLSPLYVLIIFETTVPAILIILRVITGEVFFRGFGWQMYS